MGRISKNKPGLLIRLSNLILIQVAFIFAALALILFSPDNIPESRNEQSGYSSFLSAWEKKLDLSTSEPAVYDSLVAELGDSLWHSSPLVTAALFKVERRKVDGIHPMFTRRRVKGVGKDSLAYREATVDPELLRFVGEREIGYDIAVMHGPRQTAHISKIAEIGETALVLYGEIEHDWLVSKRKELLYALGLLFLCSTLISLLTIHLVLKRVKVPLDRVIHGFELAANNQRCQLTVTAENEELGRLTQSFNLMSEKLWENHHDLKQYNLRLKKTNVALINSQVFMATLIHTSPSSIIVTSSDGTVMLANEAALHDFGYRSGEANGKQIEELIALTTGFDSESDANGGDVQHGEALCRRADGKFFPAYVIKSTIRTGSDFPQAYLYHVNNISESTAFQEMVVRLDRLATRGEMAGDIAHEINNFLAILSGNLELLPIVLRKGDQEKIDKRIVLMRETVDRIAQFANGLMESTKDESLITYCSLNQTVENVIAFLKPQNKFDTIELSAEPELALPMVKMDPAQLQQLIVNLVYNAADAVSEVESGAWIRVRTSVRDRSGRQCVVLEVCDNGPGVPEDKVEMLFQKRFTTRRKGHGIGLITCRRIAEAHRGTISYDYDHGAVFRVEIPVDYDQRELSCSSATSSVPATS